MAKMDKKWVVLCSSAVAAIYASGYFTTESQAEAIIKPRQQTQIHIQQNHDQTYNSQSNSTANNSSQQQNSLYKDGTYQGTGMNRRGSIEVTVTIKNNKITDVEISDFEMHYSESDVVNLPGEVVQNQSAQVRNVSGATYSTQAFVDAVQEALLQAQSA